MANQKKKPQHYVDNKKFLQALKEYKDACTAAKKAKEDKPSFPVTIDIVNEVWFVGKVCTNL